MILNNLLYFRIEAILCSAEIFGIYEEETLKKKGEGGGLQFI